MPKAVLDTTVLVSAFLTAQQGGVSYDVLSEAHNGAYELVLSDDILEETARVLASSQKLRKKYHYPDAAIVEYCRGLARLGSVIAEVPLIRVVRDPADDMILGCAIAAKVQYLVSRDKDLLSLGAYKTTEVITPETFLRILRGR